MLDKITRKKIDVRKFIRSVNTGLAAQIAEAAGCVQATGRKLNQNWELISLNGNELVFEDVSSKQYVMAKYSSKPQPSITDIVPISLIDESKHDEFSKSCKMLIEAIETDDKKAAQSAFNRMSLHRFSSKTISDSGTVRCKDGNTYTIPISERTIFTEDEKMKIVKEAVAFYTNDVLVSESGSLVTSGSFDIPKIDPVLSFVVRARNLRQAALLGHNNIKFRNSVLESASLLAEGKEEAAAKTIGRVLQTDEEFTLLTESEMIKVVDNCLCTEAIFNDTLAQDLGVMAHNLNIKLHRDTIVKEWKTVAQKSGSIPLLENTHKLDVSADFRRSHGKFIHSIFEDAGGRDTKALMLRTTLEKMSKDIPGIGKDPKLNEKMHSLVARLKDNEVDEATLFEAEDVVAAVGDELQNTETLDDFDAMGGGDTDEFDITDLDDSAADATVDAPPATPAAVGTTATDGQGTTITINSPLIQIGGASGGDAAATETPDAGLGDLGGDETVDDLDVNPDDLDLDLTDGDESGGDPLAPGGEEDENFDFDMNGEPKENENPFGESANDVHYEMKNGSEDDMPPASYPKKVKISESVKTYGQKLLKNSGLIDDVVTAIHRIVLAGHNNITEAAKFALKSLDISYPKTSVNQVIKEAVEAYEEVREELSSDIVEDCDAGCPKCHRPMELQSGKLQCTSCIRDLGESADEEDEDIKPVQERLRGPNINPLGIKNSDRIDAPTGSKVLEWSKRGDDISYGICEGTKFVLSHKIPNNMELRSSDGSVTIPVPITLCESALGSLKFAVSDSKPFDTWVQQIVESISPLDEDESGIDDIIDTDDNDDMSSPYSSDDGLGDDELGDDEELFRLTMVNMKTGDGVGVTTTPDGKVVPINSTSGNDSEEDLDDLSDDSDDSDVPDLSDVASDDGPDSDDGDDDSDDEDSDDDGDDAPDSDDGDDDGDDAPDSDDGDDDGDSDDDGDDAPDSDDDTPDDKVSGKEKPSFIKESDNLPEFLQKKLKGSDKSDDESDDSSTDKTDDSKKKEAKTLEETIEEGPYDEYDENEPQNERSEINFGFYWYASQGSKGAWFIGDGPSGIDQPAPPVVQGIADKIGLTQKVINGEISPDQLIFGIRMAVDTSGGIDTGDNITPSFDDRSKHISSATCVLDLPDGTKKNIELSAQTVNALNNEFPELG